MVVFEGSRGDPTPAEEILGLLSYGSGRVRFLLCVSVRGVTVSARITGHTVGLTPLEQPFGINNVLVSVPWRRSWNLILPVAAAAAAAARRGCMAVAGVHVLVLSYGM
ncbi:hypothetical protein E2C01_053269 [Portunus trituberculatus]|uniref:Uncharacterized protein n=1 Tax=Portunus trituberculatus TaxID=210409 RepID=A0A5B7GNW4_PORTR|nr:hypothetical protein [Portunus trituberculatus]